MKWIPNIGYVYVYTQEATRQTTEWGSYQYRATHTTRYQPWSMKAKRAHEHKNELLDVRVHLQFKHSPRHRQWGPTGTGQWPIGQHQYGRTELPSGSLSFHLCQSCGVVTQALGPGNGWCWHGHPLQLRAGHCVRTLKSNEQQVNTSLVQEWRCACTSYMWKEWTNMCHLLLL